MYSSNMIALMSVVLTVWLTGVLMITYCSNYQNNTSENRQKVFYFIFWSQQLFNRSFTLASVNADEVAYFGDWFCRW